MTNEWIRVAESSQVRERFGLSISLHGKSIVLFRYDGKVYALRDSCPHQGAPLSDGYVQNGVLTCPHHGWNFNISNGAFVQNQAIRVPSYEVKEAAGTVYVKHIGPEI
jgi:nitrite reductase (NADH) small subunit/3-phenylpropionate/trans-cinnamate dioxygenase ferredoxin subunit